MVPVTLFDIPERKFKYAFCVEVAEWLIQQRITKSERQLEIDLSAIESTFPLLKLFILDYGYLLSESDLIKLLKLESESGPVQTYYLNKQPFALFRIDHRHTKRFALTIEAFQYLIVPD